MKYEKQKNREMRKVFERISRKVYCYAKEREREREIKKNKRNEREL